MTDKPETALARWSRLKRAGTESEPPTPPDDGLPVAEHAVPPETAGDGNQETPPDRDDASDAAVEPDLPDIADLNADSDFSVFLRKGVSEEIRRKALRVLWRSDPVLANLDGLNDYDEDFRATGALARAARTAYRVGKGYLREREEEAVETAEPSPEAPADATVTAAAAPEGVDNGEATGTADRSRPAGEEAADGGEPEEKS